MKQNTPYLEIAKVW